MAALLKPNRSRQSFVGGSGVFNATFPRGSEDMDVYAHAPIGDVAARDAATLRGAGLTVEIGAIGTADILTWTAEEADRRR